MTFTRTLAFAIVAAVVPFSVQAHRAWLLPAATVLSSENPWVTVDAAVSNDIFHMDWAPLRLDSLVVTAPDVTTVTPQNTHTGKYRSSFDLELTQKGTYRVAIVNAGLMASYEQNGERKRWRGTPERFAQEIPKDAENVQVTQSAGRIETFITSGSPTQDALKPTGKGLELVPMTHPNDLFAGEAATFKLFLDGKPAADLDVVVIPGGMRYRSAQGDINAKTGADGEFVVTWPTAGMYWLEASISDDKTSVPPATQRRASYVGTFEVLPQ
jgi:uncharacterized GH25 family protein